MKPTELLIEEHNSIKIMLKIIDVACHHLELGQDVDPNHLEQMVKFIKMFADQCHHGKEEDLLFDAMEASGIPTKGGPIGVMLMEHTIGRGYVKKMSEAIDQYKKGVHKISPIIIDNAKKYTSLLLQHIEKEDNILYPMADRYLSEEQQKKLLKEFKIVDSEKIGFNRIEELHTILNQLKSIYLD